MCVGAAEVWHAGQCGVVPVLRYRAAHRYRAHALRLQAAVPRADGDEHIAPLGAEGSVTCLLQLWTHVGVCLAPSVSARICTKYDVTTVVVQGGTG